MKTSLGAVVYLFNSMIKLINYEIFSRLITEIFGSTVKCYEDVVLPKLSKNAGENELEKYEERHINGNETEVCLCSATFARQEISSQGIKWLHIHESSYVPQINALRHGH